MTAAQIGEHAGYVGDEVKISAYARALREVVHSDSCVLDLGAGTGLLGLLAAKAGARIVYAVDSGSILGVAQAIATANGLVDRIVHVRDRSTRVELPEPVDVVVCDQIGGLAYDAGVLGYYADARQRLLAPGGILVPGSFTLLAAPVACAGWSHDVSVWSSNPGGFDFGPMAQLAANTMFGHRISASQFLAEPAAWAEIRSDCVGRISGTITTRIERPGSFNGIAGLFVAQLSPSVTLSNSPFRLDQFERWQNFYPLPSTVHVEPGDEVDLTIDLRPEIDLANWSVEVRHGAIRSAPTRHNGSTVMGTFLTSHDLTLAAGSAVPRRSSAVEADRYILDCVDGRRTEAEIIEAVWSGGLHSFRSRDEAEHRVRDLLNPYMRPEPPWHTAPMA